MPAPKGNDYAKGNPGGGRDTLYDPKFVPIAEKMSHMGATDADLAQAFGVCVATIRTWKSVHEEFSSALKLGKAAADARVERSLYEKACGYSHPDTHFSAYDGHVTETPTVKHYAPDTTAAIFWLKNRKPAEWRDKQEVDVSIPGLKEFFDLLPKEHGLPKND